MKTRVTFTMFLALGSVLAGAATNDPEATLQRGLFEEEANHDLPAAIRAYQSVVTQFDQNRKLAATAVFRLGECYRRQGKTNEASAQYERVLREFSDQSPLIALSRQNLALMGVSVAATETTLSSTAARQEQKRLLEEEIKLVDQKLAAQQKQVQVGALSREELIPTQRELLELRRKIAAIDAGTPMMLSLAEGEAAAPTSKEAEEVKRIQAMIKDSPDLINAPDKSGKTPLHLAAAEGQLVVADFLLRNGADPNSRDHQEATPLFEAASNGRKAMVELLIQHKADPALVTLNGWTPLYRATEKGFLSVVQVLLARGANPNAKNKDGATPLHAAIGARQLAIIEALLAQKVDVNARAADGWTPLHIAAARGLEAIAEQLIQRGAEVDAKDNLGRTPLACAVEQHQTSTVKLLLTKKADPNVEFQVERNNKKLSTYPLFEAVSTDGLELCELLLEAGANPNRQIPDQYPPLLMAVLKKRIDVVAQLLNHGADPRIPDTSGSVPLHYALKQPSVMDFLLSTNAAVNSPNERGETPLFWAAAAGLKPAAELLLTHQANPNLRDKEGRTPLHLAVLRRNGEMVKLLLENGADPNIPDNSGRTPLDWARNAPQYQSVPVGGEIELPRYISVTPWVSPPGQGRPIQPGLGLPALPGYPRQASGSPPEEPSTIAAALKSHGAVEELPDFTSIRMTRPGWAQSYTVFESNTNGLNKFTLLEAVSFIFDHGLPNSYPVTSVLFGSLSFPNLSRVFIHRRDPKQPARSIDLEVNLLDAAGGFDCSKDVLLEFGDVIEISEREHNLAETTVALSDFQRATLPRCLMRQVKFVVKGQVKEVTLRACYLSQALNLPEVQGILLSSSDLSAVRFKRTGPGVGTAEVTENAKAISDQRQLLRNDLWLHNGDVIEVPEKP